MNKKSIKRIVTRLVSAVLIAVLLLTFVNVRENAQAATKLDEELERIKSYKLFPDSVFGKILRGRNHEASGNRFYIGAYSSNTLIKDGLIYALNRSDKTASVVGLSRVGLTAVSVPKKVKDGKKSYTVTDIAPYAFDKEAELKTVTIKSTKLSKIGAKAFRGLKGKTEMKLPKSCKKKYSAMLSNAGYNNNPVH
ncbi:MAG: hypothetical protein K5655_02540 [Lachnospiraceae bacterium]|nr:hypothetical protein [Lachnospiraceae bacterium]